MNAKRTKIVLYIILVIFLCQIVVGILTLVYPEDDYELGSLCGWLSIVSGIFGGALAISGLLSQKRLNK